MSQQSEHEAENSTQDQEASGQLDLEATIQKLEQRIEYLEQSNRVYLDALELAKSFGDFQESINELREPRLILSETKSRAWKLIEFDAQAIFLMQEENSNFRLAACDPEDMKDLVLEEFEVLIEDSIVAMAINDNRPIMLSSSTKEYQLLVHVMATCSRVRGMFLGLIKSTEAEIPEVLLSLLSILLNSSANALESYELYGVIREQKNQLEELLRQKTGELNGLQDEIDIRVQKKLEQMQAELDKAQEKSSDSNIALSWFKDYCLLNTSKSKKSS
ncbi:MAG: hypothetical protein R6U55_15825 [Desulfovermiculus sp.]